MKIKCNIVLFIIFTLFLTKNYATEKLPSHLTSLQSSAGLSFLKKNLDQNGLNLLAHFTTQKTNTYCGIASMVMVLNSLSKSAPIDNVHAPYHYFTQDNFFNEKVEKIISQNEVNQKGIKLSTMHLILQSYGLQNTIFYANKTNFINFKKTLIKALHNNQYVIVNFFRKSLLQKGAGHHSPIAAYDEQTDQFLILDVARFKYPAFWVKARDLWNAINTKDDNSFRGFIIITPMTTLL